MAHPLFWPVLAALAGAPQPSLPSWQLPQAHLSVALVCLRGHVGEPALQAAAKSFGAARSLTWETAPRADLPQLDPEALGSSLEKLDPKEQAAVKAAAAAPVLHFTWPRTDTAALAQAYAAAGALAGGCRGVIVDLITLTVFSGERWKTSRVELATWPLLAWKHFAIHMVPNDDGSLMFDTGGLARFGLVDLVLPRIPRSEVRAAGLMLNTIVQRLVEGAAPNAKGQVSVRLDELQEPAFKKAQLASAFENAKRELTVDFKPSPGTGPLRPGTWLVGFPTLKCQSTDVCLDRAIELLFGSEDKTTTVKHDAKVLAARDRARTLLRPYQARLAKGFPGHEYLLVKGPFPYDDGTEWMWVEVEEWKGGVLRGLLRSQPEYAPGLRPGARVEVKEGEVFDFMYKLEDGSFYGNETGKVMQPEVFEELGGGRSRLRD